MSVTLYGSGQTVLQVASTTYTGNFTSSSSSYVNVTGFSVSITPQSINSKILILFNVIAASSDHSSFRITRNGTVVSVGTPSGSQTASMLGDFFYNYNSAESIMGGTTYLDNPATTSSLTYQVQVLATVGSGTLTMNANYQNNNASYTMAGTSAITVLEISGS